MKLYKTTIENDQRSRQYFLASDKQSAIDGFIAQFQEQDNQRAIELNIEPNNNQTIIYTSKPDPNDKNITLIERQSSQQTFTHQIIDTGYTIPTIDLRRKDAENFIQAEKDAKNANTAVKEATTEQRRRTTQVIR